MAITKYSCFCGATGAEATPGVEIPLCATCPACGTTLVEIPVIIPKNAFPPAVPHTLEVLPVGSLCVRCHVYLGG